MTRWRSPVAITVRLVAAFVAGFAVLLLLFPYSGDDSDPPTCFSVFGYVVPCGGGFALAAAAGTAVVAGLALFALGRGRR